MTTICSWDVGIKHLAYCIMHKKNNNINIIRWDIINLVKDDDKYTKQAEESLKQIEEQVKKAPAQGKEKKDMDNPRPNSQHPTNAKKV